MRKDEVVVGETYARWTVLSPPFLLEGRGEYRVAAQCACGTLNPALFIRVMGSKSQSCGCSQRSSGRGRVYHGDHKTRLNGIWRGFRNRCNSPNNTGYKNYGGRGISYDPAWDDYLTFKKWALKNGYEDGLELDRINNDGDYTPKNCRWSTRDEQARNTSRVRLLTAFGETKTRIEWSEDRRCIVNYGTLESRMRRGWDAQRAMTTPSETKFRNGR